MQLEQMKKHQTVLNYHLGDPYMTMLHRAGLAGLYMTLEQFEKEKITPFGGFTWQKSDRSITLSWEGNDREVLDWLLKESFQLRDGLIYFRALGDVDIQPLVTLHQGILGSFLQHNSTHKSTGKQSKSFMLEEGKPELIIEYKALSTYSHQDFTEKLCDSKTGKLLGKTVAIAGWLSPGAVVKHIAFSGQTAFEETASSALLLLFAPIACCFFGLRSKLKEQKAQYALVIPEVTNLSDYSYYRREYLNLGFRDFYASSLGDAGLKFLIRDSLVNKTGGIIRNLRIKTCHVITLGSVPWAGQQKTRTDVYTVSANETICTNYYVACDHLSDRVIDKKDNSSSWIAPSFAREIIADNLARGKPWFADLSAIVNSGTLFQQLLYEREGLHKMIKDQRLQWTDQQRLFVQACHEAISKTYGQLSSRNQKNKEDSTQDSDIKSRFEKVNVKFRTGLARCKNAISFREFITNFWAKAGYIPTLQNHWEEVMKLVISDWRSARDLALLALASYKGKESKQQSDNSPELPSQEETLSSIGTIDDGFDEEE
ncbi:MAG: type I-MYXAN CRISPR-associated Cas8a1/Cmx1 [Pseudanabaenaceae cyanobacterium]